MQTITLEEAQIQRAEIMANLPPGEEGVITREKGTPAGGDAVTPSSLEILYEDNHCLAIAKPSGAVSAHFQGKEETLDVTVKAYLKEKYHKPGNVFLGVIHRLDRVVSGVLLFARNSKAAERLSRQV